MGKEILTKTQVKFLETIANSTGLTETFYLTGGTALSAFYLNHRESEDLDFFSEKEIDLLAINIFLKSEKEKLGWKKLEFQQSFNRNLFFLHLKDGVLKTEFTYFPFKPLLTGKKMGRLAIDSLRDIAVNKVFAISQQTRARDFVDVFFIVKNTGWRLRDLIKDARLKFDAHTDPIQLGAQLLKIKETKDFPRLRASFIKKEMESFFLKEAVSLKKEIFKP